MQAVALLSNFYACTKMIQIYVMHLLVLLDEEHDVPLSQLRTGILAWPTLQKLALCVCKQHPQAYHVNSW